jgi:hypothetical protein
MLQRLMAKPHYEDALKVDGVIPITRMLRRLMTKPHYKDAPKADDEAPLHGYSEG